MTGKVETRRSGRQGNITSTISNTRGTRSSASFAAITQIPETQISSSPHPSRKRSRLDPGRETLSNDMPAKDKEKRRHESIEPKDETEFSPAATAALDDPMTKRIKSCVKKPSRKATPLLERMKTLEFRYMAVVTALMIFEAAHIDEALAEIKKGCCDELNSSFEPLDEQRRRKITIAERKLALRKEQVDREWRAGKTSAQYDFIKRRADLKSTMRQNLSQQVFDVNREFRDLSMTTLGITPELRHLHRPRASSPQGVSLTEKDEDFLLMDIMPKVSQSAQDVAIFDAAPILDQMLASNKQTEVGRPTSSLARPQKRGSRNFGSISDATPSSGPKTSPVRQSYSTRPRYQDEAIANQTGPLPGIESLIKKDRPTKRLRTITPPKHGYIPGHDHPSHSSLPQHDQNPRSVGEPSSSHHGYPSHSDFSHRPYSHSHNPSHQSRPLVVPELPEMRDRGLPALMDRPSSQYGRHTNHLGSWASSEPSQLQPLSNGLHDDYRKPEGHERQIRPNIPPFNGNSSGPAISSNSAFNATIGTHAQYVPPGHSQYLPHHLHQAQNIPMLGHFTHPNSVSSLKGTSMFNGPHPQMTAPNHAIGGHGLLHPFKKSSSTSPGLSSNLINQGPLRLDDNKFISSTPIPPLANKANGILWGGLRR